MKYPKTEPYRRSRHRAALHAWVVAATAVAAIGIPASATAEQRDSTLQHVHNNDQPPTQDAQSVASFWIDAMQAGDIDAAMSLMRLPASSSNQQAVQTDLNILSDMLAHQNVRAQPVAHRYAGHWALSAWALDAPEVSMAPVIEPITLYNPSSDGLYDSVADWQVVPQGVAEDVAIKPLYNADHEALQAWAQTLL